MGRDAARRSREANQGSIGDSAGDATNTDVAASLTLVRVLREGLWSEEDLSRLGLGKPLW